MSYGSKNTLVIPTEVVKPTEELNVIVLLLIFVGAPVICFEMVKSELPKSTISTSDFGN